MDTSSGEDHAAMALRLLGVPSETLTPGFTEAIAAFS